MRRQQSHTNLKRDSSQEDLWVAKNLAYDLAREAKKAQS